MVKKEFVEERQNQILAYVNSRQRADVQELAEKFQVTEVTIRRDLVLLEKQNLLVRTHGGALSLNNHSVWRTTDLGYRQSLHAKEKEAIAEYVVSIVENGDSIFLDSSSTTLAIAKLLATAKNNIMVVTNGLTIAQTLADVNNNRVILTGGRLMKDVDALLGDNCLETISHYRTDKAIVGISGIICPDGYFGAIPEEAAVKRSMLKNSKYSIIVSDSSKVGATAFAYVSNLKTPDLLVVDEKITIEQQTELQRCGAHVKVVPLKEKE